MTPSDRASAARAREIAALKVGGYRCLLKLDPAKAREIEFYLELSRRLPTSAKWDRDVSQPLCPKE